MNKLKALSIAACCLVASLWSETQGMDNQQDILESATVSRTSNIQSISQSEIDSLAGESTPSQLINLEDSHDSWASYLISPVKATMQMANKFISIAKGNPKLAMVVGFTYILPTLVVAQECCVRTYMTFNQAPCDLWLSRSETCPETSNACSYAQGCYKQTSAYPGCKMSYNKDLSVSISSGACPVGGQ